MLKGCEWKWNWVGNPTRALTSGERHYLSGADFLGTGERGSARVGGAGEEAARGGAGGE
jgi:hypothetical protein